MPRPLNASKDEVLAQTLELISRHDIAGFSIDKLTSATNVSKSTLYRLWPSKEDLVCDAISTLRFPSTVPDSGDVASDLKIAINNLIDFLEHPNVGRVFAAFLNAAVRNEKYRSIRKGLTSKAVQPFVKILSRAVDRGLLDLKLPVNLCIDVLISPLAYRSIAALSPIDKDQASALIDFFVHSNRAELSSIPA